MGRRIAQSMVLAGVAAGIGCAPPPPLPQAQAQEIETDTAALEVCADGPTVFGIDVSKWQGDIDWDRVAAAGVRYAFIRTSHGLRVLDEKFERNWSEAGRVGILRGVYQYFSPGQDAQDQADYVVDQLRQHGAGELPPVIDVEETDGRGAAEIEGAVADWLDVVQDAVGVPPIIYSGRYFWQDNVANSRQFADHPLWHPQYTEAACPNIAGAWDRWAFWQYSSTGRVDGIRGAVDLNRFNGSEDDLGVDLGQLPPIDGDPPPVWAGEPKGQSFPLASQDPIELCVGQTLAGHMRVKNVGNQVWDDGVRLAPTPRDVASPLAADSWISDVRITSPDQPTAPGEQAHFSFEIKGGAVGAVDQTFGLVAEGITWFADAGGPADDYLELIVDVVDCPADSDDQRPPDDPDPDPPVGDDPADAPEGDPDPEDMHEPRPFDEPDLPPGAGGDLAGEPAELAGKANSSGCAVSLAPCVSWLSLPLRR